ncbi:GL17280 [Drosophila persimilis]|uniref:GL17280 n=1 Tax=Drosophila persimilis TaxID=7234 RepID=B4GG33_DROPE|nr:band 7 protein AGAP004871 isoform X1 [Drosophila persimilis]EDW35453.1 GL17280 [Drosophila persimilis]
MNNNPGESTDGLSGEETSLKPSNLIDLNVLRPFMRAPYLSAMATDRNVPTTENIPPNLLERIFYLLSVILMVITFPISVFMCLVILQEYQRAVILRLGRLLPGGPRGPGLVFILPCIDAYIKVDLRTTSFDVSPQEILTKDMVTIKVDAVVYYSIKQPIDAVLQVFDHRGAVELLAKASLRNVAGTHMLLDLLMSKETLSKRIEAILDDCTDPWGVRVERVEVKEILLPDQLRRALAVEQEALREAKAKVAAAQGERDAVKTLKEAADIMETNPIALQLRYLQTLNTICNDKTLSYVFPFPVDIVRKMMK